MFKFGKDQNVLFKQGKFSKSYIKGKIYHLMNSTEWKEKAEGNWYIIQSESGKRYLVPEEDVDYVS